MKTKVLTFILAIMASTLWAADFKSGELYYNITSATAPYTVEVTYESTSQNYKNLISIEIPASVNHDGIDYAVTGIGENAFAYCLHDFSTIEIPEGIEHIGDKAFLGSDLETIIIPKSLKSIGKQVFTSVKSVIWNAINCADTPKPGTYPLFGYNSKVTSFVFGVEVEYIPAWLCYKIPITSIEIPTSVTSIGDYAFYECKDLTSVTIPTSVTSIGNHAFYACKALASINLPNSIVSIGEYALTGCNGLTSITIPENVASIGKSAFSSCEALKSIVWNARSCADVSGLFYSAPITSFTFGENVMRIPSSLCSKITTLTSVTIPENVTSIGEYAFSGCTALTSANLPKSLTSISNGLFSECSALTSITIPEGVISIGDGAFTEAVSLTSITIPEGVVSIGKRAFYKCINLAKVTILSTTINIGYDAFYGCYFTQANFINNSPATDNSGATIVDEEVGGLLIKESVIINTRKHIEVAAIPSHVTSIASKAFVGCERLTSVSIPDNSVRTIGNEAFMGCKALNSVAIGAGVTKIGKKAFYDCTALSEVTMGDGTTSIGYEAFTNTGIYNDKSKWTNGVLRINNYIIKAQTSLSGDLTIDDTIFAIASGAFEGCSSITSLNLGNGVKAIGYKAFYGCSSIKAIEIPESVTILEDQAFSKCSLLTSITWNAKDCEKVYADETPMGSLPGMVGNSVIKDAFAGIREQIMSFTIGADIEIIPSSLCREMASLRAIELPDGLKEIGVSAFRGCKALASITMPQGVTSIGGSAFSNCLSLRTITIPENVASIGHEAFYNCRALTSIVWNAKDCARFYNNMAMGAADCIPFEGEYITSLTFGDKVERIPEYLCCGGMNITSITIPSSVVSIGTRAFENCKLLTSVSISDNVESIESSAFNGCEALLTLVIGDGVKSIGDYAFISCEALSTVTLGSALESIGYRAFAYCSSITTLTIPKKVTTIGEAAFRYCTSLESVVMNEGLTSIGTGAFYGCSSLTSFTIPKSVTDIEGYAFAECSGLLDVYCYADEVPTTDSKAFSVSYIEDATLYVPAVALDDYKSSSPWNSFGAILPLEGEQPEEQPTEEWSEWETVGNAVTTEGKESIITTLQSWGEGNIEAWEEPITIDQRYNKADPTKKQLRLNGIFNDKEIVLNYDSSTTTITAEKQSTGYATNKAMIESQGLGNVYDEFVFFLNAGTYSSITGVINMSDAFFYINERQGFNIGLSLQIEGITPPTFTGQWNRKYVGREGGEAIFTTTFEEPIVKYRALVLAPGESLTVAAVKALYAANPETNLKYVESHNPEFAITCDKMGTYRVVFIPISADGTAVMDYQIASMVSYAEPEYDTYEWEYIGESTVSEHVGSLLIPNDELWEEVDGGLVNKYPFMTTSEGVKTYRRADNPNIIGLCNLYGEKHTYSSMFHYIDQAQDWWIYIDITNPTDVKMLTTPVGAVSSQVGYATFITQYPDAGAAATLAEGVITFPNGSILLNNILNQDFEAEYDFKIILPRAEEEEEDNGILTISAKPVLISTQGGTIAVSGLTAGTTVSVYDIVGRKLATATATGGIATLATDLTTGDIAIVKIGEHNIKVSIR